MTIRYYNRHTGDTAVFERPNARLDALTNWVRVRDGEPLPELVADGVLNRPQRRQLATTEPTASGSAPGPRASDALPLSPPLEGPQPPGRSAPKAEWAEYARTVAEGAEELDAIDSMTRDQLIDAYGAI